MKLAVALTLAASANAFAPTPVGNVSRKKNVKNGPSELHEIDRDQNGTCDAAVDRVEPMVLRESRPNVCGVCLSTSLIVDGRSVQF